LDVDRRALAIACLFFVAAGIAAYHAHAADEAIIEDVYQETMFYQELENGAVQCGICFRECILQEGEVGFCRNRKNIAGALYNVVYGRPSAVQIDPVEKEPQHHFLPGTRILCIGTAGCNFRCRFCHNWTLSQRDIDTVGRTLVKPPEAIIREAQDADIPSISFTYNEPTAFYEYAYDTAKLAQDAGLNVIFHSNGSMNPEPLRALLQYTDAATIDLKAFDDSFYREVTEGRLDPVLRTLEIIYEEGVWLEIVNLVIPTLNDSPEDIRAMCRWIREHLGPEVPVHFNRFTPAYRLSTLKPTPIETLEMAYDIAREEGLEFVVIGNVPGHRKNSTFCPECDAVLIERHHFTVREYRIDNGGCPDCGRKIPGRWR